MAAVGRRRMTISTRQTERQATILAVTAPPARERDRPRYGRTHSIELAECRATKWAVLGGWVVWLPPRAMGRRFLEAAERLAP